MERRDEGERVAVEAERLKEMEEGKEGVAHGRLT